MQLDYSELKPALTPPARRVELPEPLTIHNILGRLSDEWHKLQKVEVRRPPEKRRRA